MYVIFCSEMQLKKGHTAVSKHLGILLNIRTGDYNARASVKTASSAAIIVCFVGVSMNCNSLYVQYDMKCGGSVVDHFIDSVLSWLFSTPSGKPTVRDTK